MSSPLPAESVRYSRRFRLTLVALVCLIVAVGVFGASRWLAGGSSHTTTPRSGSTLTEANVATQAAQHCAQAVASERPGASWIPMTSTAPSDIAAMMNGDWVPNLESRVGPLTLDTPALVYPLDMSTGYDANDCPHWVASYHDSAGQTSGVMDYVFDPSHNSVRFSTAGTIFPGDSRFGKTFPYVTLDQALALLRQQRGVSGSTEQAPMLVFFALKQGWGGSEQPPDRNATHFWTDSGTVAVDPIWRIIGADGKAYFVGAKQRVYAEADVPIA